jgi:hypothetical protein
MIADPGVALCESVEVHGVPKETKTDTIRRVRPRQRQGLVQDVPIPVHTDLGLCASGISGA